MNRKLRPLLAALCVLFLILVFFSGWKVFSILHGYKDAERRYDSLAGAVVAAPSSSEETVLSPAASLEEGEKPDAQPTEQDSPQEVSPVSVDFDVLNQLGGRVIAWIHLPHTIINYPVAQSADNEYYLERFLDGSSISGGTLFADCACPSDLSGQNTIIYGHNMKDGSMFALIDDYANQTFYEEHPVMYLNTPSKNYRIDIFSCFTTDPESFVYTPAFASTEDYAAFLQRLKDSSEINCGIEPSSDGKTVTLSTCTYTGDDLRFVVCGMLTEIG